MRYKMIFVALFIVAILGCKSQNNVLEKEILGKWRLCKIYNGKIATSFNICPEIFFKDKGKGFLQTKSIFEFEWTMSETNIISLKFKDNLDADDIMLGLSACTVIYKYNEKLEYLELENIKSGRRYILSRDGNFP